MCIVIAAAIAIKIPILTLLFGNIAASDGSCEPTGISCEYCGFDEFSSKSFHESWNKCP